MNEAGGIDVSRTSRHNAGRRSGRREWTVRAVDAPARLGPWQGDRVGRRTGFQFSRQGPWCCEGEDLFCSVKRREGPAPLRGAR